MCVRGTTTAWMQEVERRRRPKPGHSSVNLAPALFKERVAYAPVSFRLRQGVSALAHGIHARQQGG